MPPQKKKARSDGPATPMPTQRTMMNFMWRFALCAAAVKEWSLGIVYEDSAAKDKATALGLLKKTVLGVAAFAFLALTIHDLGYLRSAAPASTGCRVLRGSDAFASSEDQALWKDGEVVVSAGDLRGTFEDAAPSMRLEG